ncbi:fibrous sheath CABYR-binding protein-like [Drosophila persimilis]|uniref:fibrous sheath CABYR-binding protein-like n=1 Tax=Drosophila persimilis TaxID=7234 RepID=UPI000F090D37|nr:fibrous sheath CABYR-binding protein-like [Drosophila persimilis]
MGPTVSPVREEWPEGGRRGRTETRKEEPSERASKRASTRSTRTAKEEESSARTRGRSTARRGDQRPTDPQVEEPQPTPTETAVKEPQTTPTETAVKEPQATQADIAENNAAAEARRLAEWHRRDEEEAECPPAPKAARVQSPEEEWQERLRRAEVEEEELWQPPPEHVESEEEPRPQAPPSPGAEEELFQRRPPADNARCQGDQQQLQQRGALRGLLVQTLHISWASGPAPQQPGQEAREARLWEEAPRASDERDPRRRARPQESTGPAVAPTAEEE